MLLGRDVAKYGVSLTVDLGLFKVVEIPVSLCLNEAAVHISERSIRVSSLRAFGIRLKRPNGGRMCS